MSDPPPTAVLITNSTGRLGCVTVATEAEAATVALGEGAVAPPPHAVATSIPAPRIDTNRLLVTRHIAFAPPRTRTPFAREWLNSGLTSGILAV